MSKIKHDLLTRLLVIFSCYLFAQCKTIKRVSDYDSQSVYSDYFDTTVNDGTTIVDEQKSIKNVESDVKNATHDVRVSESVETDDDGVTCSDSNVTKVLSAFDVEHSVLVLFRLNVSANDRELVFFLNLARRFSEASALFVDHRFIVVTTDHSSDIVRDFIDSEGYPNDILVIDDEDYPDMGFVIDFDELHVYVVDQCGRLAYIIVPPWSSAQHPYVKAAVLSTILDLPCDCSSDLISDPYEGFEGNKVTEPPTVTTTDFSSSPLISSTNSNTRSTDDNKENLDDIENIEHLLDNANSINDSFLTNENSSLPLKIIISSSHVHFNNESQNYYKYEEIVFKSGDESYHQHFNPADVLLDISDERLQNFTDSNIFVGNNSFADIKELAPNKKILVNRFGYFYEVLKKQTGNSYEIVPLNFDVLKVQPKIQIFGVKHHYKQLNKWLFYKI